MRENVNLLKPIQLGIAVATADGLILGAWSFNMHFDADADLYAPASMRFLTNAGIDFRQHAAAGIDAMQLGHALCHSPLTGTHALSPLWVTFSGDYDLGYLVKLLSGRRLPQEMETFNDMLAVSCP